MTKRSPSLISISPVAMSLPFMTAGPPTDPLGSTSARPIASRLTLPSGLCCTSPSVRNVVSLTGAPPPRLTSSNTEPAILTPGIAPPASSVSTTRPTTPGRALPGAGWSV